MTRDCFEPRSALLGSGSPAPCRDDFVVGTAAGADAVGEAADDKKIQDFNYRAAKESIARAVNGEPKVAEVVAKRNQVKHPFAAA